MPKEESLGDRLRSAGQNMPRVTNPAHPEESGETQGPGLRNSGKAQQLGVTTPLHTAKSGANATGSTAPQDRSSTLDPTLDVAGFHRISQKNKFLVDITLYQAGGHIWGTASHSGGRVESTAIDGTVVGEKVTFTITWNNGTRGRYTTPERLTDGPFTEGTNQGILGGDTEDELNPGSRSTWEFENSFTRVLARK